MNINNDIHALLDVNSKNGTDSIEGEKRRMKNIRSGLPEQLIYC